MRSGFLFLFFAAAAPLFSADFTFASKGAPAAKIVLPASPAPEEETAADVLKRHLDEITGGSFEIVRGPCEGPRIAVGGIASLPEDLRRRLRAGEDIFYYDPANHASVCAIRGDTLYLCGHLPVSTGYAVNHLLHALGVRYYTSSPAGRIIPKDPGLKWSAKEDLYMCPTAWLRSLYNWGGESRQDTERLKDFLAMNCFTGGLEGDSGHNFGSVWDRKKYPELFPKTRLEDSVQVSVTTIAALKYDPKAQAAKQAELESKAKEEAKVRKKQQENEQLAVLDQATAFSDILDQDDKTLEFRNTALNKTAEEKMYEPYQVCVTNPLAWKLGMDHADRCIRRNPAVPVVSYTLNDGGGGDCMCPKCKALGNNADRYVYLANRIGEEFFKKYPDKYLLIWAYANASEIPHLKIDGYDQNRDRVIVEVFEYYCRVPAPRLIEGWGKASHTLCCASTWFFFHPEKGHRLGPYQPDLEALKRSMQHKTANNVRLVSLQSPVDGVRNGFNCYVFGRLFWEPDLDIEAVRREYAEKMFPSAAADFYTLHRHLSLAGMWQEDQGECLSCVADLLLRIHDKVRNDPAQLLRWQTYGAWFELMTYPESFGYSGDKGKPQAEILKNAQRFISALKAAAPLEPVQIGVRLIHHKDIVREYIDKDLMQLEKGIPEMESELSYTEEAILAWLKDYLEKHPLPETRFESDPFQNRDER